MTLNDDLVERYGLTTQAPSVDDLILLLARVDRLENKIKLGALILSSQIDSDPTEPDWEKIRALAITVRDNLQADIDKLRAAGIAVRDRVIANEKAIVDFEARITVLEAG